jgi:hypothetical protein
MMVVLVIELNGLSPALSRTCASRGSPDRALENVFPLSTGGEREASPDADLAITLDQPSQCTSC